MDDWMLHPLDVVHWFKIVVWCPHQGAVYTETRLVIDSSASREAFNERFISNIDLIKSEVNPADSPTKLESNRALLTLLRSGKIDHPIEKMIIDK
jgi:hypothetical protein